MGTEPQIVCHTSAKGRSCRYSIIPSLFFHSVVTSYGLEPICCNFSTPKCQQIIRHGSSNITVPMFFRAMISSCLFHPCTYTSTLSMYSRLWIGLDSLLCRVGWMAMEFPKQALKVNNECVNNNSVPATEGSLQILQLSSRTLICGKTGEETQDKADPRSMNRLLNAHTNNLQSTYHPTDQD